MIYLILKVTVTLISLQHYFIDIGIQVKKYITNGALVPDHVMVSLIVSELKKLGGHSWLLDGM